MPFERGLWGCGGVRSTFSARSSRFKSSSFRDFAMASPIKIYKPPKNDVLLAFANAVDAWSSVEWQMAMLFRSLTTPEDLTLAASVLHSVTGFRNQVDMIEAAANVSLRNHPAALQPVLNLTGRARSNNTKRNALIHGRWKETECITNGQYTHTELHRDYSPDNPLGLFFKTAEDERKARGNSRFYLQDLNRAKQEFKQLADDLFAAQSQMGQIVPPRPPAKYSP